MKVNQIMWKAIATIVITTLLASNASFARPMRQEPTYDYRSLAIESVLNAAREIRSLPDVEQRVRLLIRVAEVLPTSHRDNATKVLDLVITDLDEWASEKGAGWYRRDTAAKLKSEALSLYIKLDPEKANLRQKVSESENNSGSSKGGVTPASLRGANWSRSLLDAQTSAEALAALALPMIDTDLDRACVLIGQSIQTGAFAGSLAGLFQKLAQDGNRKALDKIETAMIPALTSTSTLDSFSFAYAIGALQSDKGISPAAQSAFIFFLMNSVEGWAGLITTEAQNGGVNPSYIGSSFTTIFLNLRPVIAQYSPPALLRLDFLLAEVTPFVPEKTKSRLQAFQPETLSEPRDRLNDILKDPSPERRDLRLIGFVSQVLRDNDVLTNIGLAAEAIDGFGDVETKAAFTDLLVITRANLAIKKNNFIESQRLVGTISSPETRAWAMLALSSAAKKTDRVTRFTLTSEALTALDKVSPSPHKVELGFLGVASFVKDDPSKAFDALSTAARYANSSPAKADSPARRAIAFGLDVAIGDMHTKIGVYPAALADLRIDSSISALGTSDWFRANQIADSIRDLALRVGLKIEFARAVISEAPRATGKRLFP